MHKKKIIVICAAFCMLILVLLIFAFLQKEGAHAVVAVVGGIPVEVEQWSAVMEEKRAKVLAKYPSGLAKEEAAEELKRAALEECIRRTVILQLAKREGLINEIEYPQLKKKMEQENRERKQKKENGEIIYGVEEYTPATYFSYLLNNLIPDLKVLLKNKELKIEDGELFKYYERNPRARLRSPEKASVYIWSIEEGNKCTEEEKRNRLLEIRQTIWKQNKWDTEYENVVLTQAKVTRDSRLIQRDPALEETVFSLRDGEISEVTESGGVWRLVYCESHSPEQDVPFEDQKEYLSELLRNEKFEEYIQEKGMEVEIEETVYSEYLPK